MTDSILHNKVAEAQGLKAAVVLTGLDPATSGAVGPATQVGGLPLFQRTLLTLQRAGIGQAFVLVGADEAVLRTLLREDPRLTIAVRWLPMREFPPEDPRTWEAALGEIEGFCLVVGAQTVFSCELVERLRREAQEGQASLVLCRSTDLRPAEEAPPGSLAAGPTGPGQGLGGGVWGNAWEGRDHLADIMVVRPSLFGARARRARDPVGAAKWLAPQSVGAEARSSSGRGWVDGMIERAAAEGGLRTLSLPSSSPCWFREIHEPADVRPAEFALLRSLKGHFEGFVDRYFNRKLSILFTRFFLGVGLSANAVTVLSILIGLLSASAIAHGTYLAGLVGALLFQLSAIVDCCDGEIARLTFTESKVGEQLDLFGDNLVHIALFAGVAWAVFLQQPGVEVPRLPLWLGGAAVGANLLSLWLVVRAKALRGRGAIVAPAAAARIDFFLRHMASRDFSVALLAFALLGRLDLFLWLAALGSNVFWVMLAWVTRPSVTVRA